MILQSRKFGAFVVLSFCIVLFAPSMHAQECLKVGTKAPDFELPTINGNKISLGTYLHKNIAILHFWKSK